jgi:hypothetical protein
MSPSLNHSYLCRKIILAVEQSGRGRKTQLAGVVENEGIRVDFASIFGGGI